MERKTPVEHGILGFPRTEQAILYGAEVHVRYGTYFQSGRMLLIKNYPNPMVRYR
jgi:hypothetical protein